MPNEAITSTEPSLREYLEQRLDYERTIIAQRFELQQKAHELQAAEIARRLDELNHAHEAAVKEQARVLPREMFDQYLKDSDQRIQARVSAFTDLSHKVSRLDGVLTKIEGLEVWKGHVDGGLMLVRIGASAGIVALLLALLRSAGWIR